MNKDYQPPIDPALASASGSPAPMCRCVINMETACKEPATHHVTRDDRTLKYYLCDEHVAGYMLGGYNVVKLENADLSDRGRTKDPQ